MEEGACASLSGAGQRLKAMPATVIIAPSAMACMHICWFVHLQGCIHLRVFVSNMIVVVVVDPTRSSWMHNKIVSFCLSFGKSCQDKLGLYL